jgi:hypothetical protein
MHCDPAVRGLQIHLGVLAAALLFLEDRKQLGRSNLISRGILWCKIRSNRAALHYYACGTDQFRF